MVIKHLWRDVGFVILVGLFLLYLAGCSTQTRQTLVEINREALKTLKEGKFVGHYSFEVGESEAGVKNGAYFNPGFKLKIDGNYNYRDGQR